MQHMGPMSVATRKTLARWFDAGVARGATHLFVIYDAWEMTDYPLYAKDEREARRLHRTYRSADWGADCRLMEVYDLQMDPDAQLAEHRAMHPPGRKKPPPREAPPALDDVSYVAKALVDMLGAEES